MDRSVGSVVSGERHWQGGGEQRIARKVAVYCSGRRPRGGAASGGEIVLIEVGHSEHLCFPGKRF